MRIQNIDTLFLKVTPDTEEVFLPKERFLKNRNVSYFIPFFGNAGLVYGVDGVPLIGEAAAQNIYFDLHEANKTYKAYNLNLSLLSVQNYSRYKFDCVLDLDLSVLKIKNNTLLNNCYLPLCAVYTTESDEINTPTTQSISLVCGELNAAVIKLSDFGGYQINDKIIKKITAINSEHCYITIRTKDNKNNINDMPLMLLDNSIQFTDNDIYFDSLNIDTDNSYITITDTKADPLILTFKF